MPEGWLLPTQRVRPFTHRFAETVGGFTHPAIGHVLRNHRTAIWLLVRAGLADKELKARIVNERPVALSDIMSEFETREAARTLTGRAIEVESELKVQRATNGWI